MKLPPFEHVWVFSVEEAVAQRAEWRDEAKVLAGGRASYRCSACGSPTRLAWWISTESANSARSPMGATSGSVPSAAHRDVEYSELVAWTNPLLAAAVRLIGHVAIRNRGTIGGSMAHGDPAAELPAVLAS